MVLGACVWEHGSLFHPTRSPGVSFTQPEHRLPFMAQHFSTQELIKKESCIFTKLLYKSKRSGLGFLELNGIFRSTPMNDRITKEKFD